MSLEIPDDQLIAEKFKKNPYPFWLWLCILALLIFGLLGLQLGLRWALRKEIYESPFNRVTNREFSLFLWNNPEFMRTNVSPKTAYLPAFQYLEGSVTVEPELADEYVVAPPEVLFLYHTWKRQIGGVYFQRDIPKEEFVRFLKDAEEWKPKYWLDAPSGYVDLVKELENNPARNLQTVSYEELPKEVRQAFQGWRNYFYEGEAIRGLRPTFKQVDDLINNYPEFGRSYWKNLVNDRYLKGVANGDGKSSETVPADELSAFLKLYLYNFQQAKEGL